MSHQTQAQHLQHRTDRSDRFRDLLTWTARATMAFAAAEGVAALAFMDASLFAGAAALGAYGVLLLVLRRVLLGIGVERAVTASAAGLLIVIAFTALVIPLSAPVLAVAAVLPVALAVPYLPGARLLPLIGGSFAASVGVMVASVARGTAVAPVTPVLALLTVAGMAVASGLVLWLLWQYHSRFSDSARELSSLIGMTGYLSQTLDSPAVSDLMARLIADATGFEDCAISDWDRSRDHVVTRGYFPPERRERLQGSYELNAYPATRRALMEQVVVWVSVDDPDADPREVAYLRSIGHRVLLMLPLIAKGRTVGIVELSSSRAVRLDPARVQLAQTLAAEAAVAMENARLYEELRHQAFHDGMTGLANRLLFRQRLDHALAVRAGAHDQEVAVLFVDIDDFKRINDRLGHARADQVLVVIAERLASLLRPTDTAARLGGDEFAILITGMAGTEAPMAVAERLLAVLREPIAIAGTDVVATVSVGIAVTPSGGETSDELLRNADLAMYGAKTSGKRRWQVFEPRLRSDLTERTVLAELLEHAVERDELFLRYQPIVDLASSRIVGVESLARWQPHGFPVRNPADFIPLAEETGAIVDIGRWVVERACRQAGEWQRLLGLPDLYVTVNLSARQLSNGDLIDHIAVALRTSGLPASALVLEITEGALLQDTPDVRERLGSLRRLGVRLALDDFGTGYSSLSYLQRFPVDLLKVDQSFVRGVDADPSRLAVIRAIVQLGDALGLQTVAEGIETREELSTLKALGCAFGQGFWFARPMDTPATTALLLEGDAPRLKAVVSAMPLGRAANG